MILSRKLYNIRNKENYNIGAKTKYPLYIVSNLMTLYFLHLFSGKWGIELKTEKEIIKELKEWVEKTYSPKACGATSQWSSGNEDDCFNDGYNAGESDAAYAVGQILEMELVDPDEPEYE